ncbi:MAG: molybdopterin molybdotransferase MoeA [Flavobacteriales bacterium]|nr:molybdopterin molybdotransferase MoeA [Flavobacteriales bacterium]
MDELPGIRELITVEEARRIIMQHAPSTPAEFRALEHAVGGFAAADAFAADDYPRFDTSAVDGFAVGEGHGPWKLVGRIMAGESLRIELRPDECVRIFTGAAVPAGAAAVAMQEHIRTDDGTVSMMTGELRPGANIRRRGESFIAGELLLAKGERIGSAQIGVLASGGVQEVMVAAEPQVGILRTGDEFIEGAQRDEGRMHSSNDRMLIAAVREAWLPTDDVAYSAADDREALNDALKQAAAENDLVIATGGVSVGDHDLMRPVLEELGATIHFHGVLQKPGKPMLFASLGRKQVFGLPGNPRAVLVCWHAYVLPFIRAMQGAREPWPRSERLPLAGTVKLKGGRAGFLAAQVRGGMVHLLPDEGSHMLTTMAMADAIAYFPADGQAGSSKDVEVLYLPRP